jgi:alpha-galactosidase
VDEGDAMTDEDASKRPTPIGFDSWNAYWTELEIDEKRQGKLAP